MFETLNELLRKSPSEWPSVKHTHIDCPASGPGLASSSYLIHHFISNYLKQHGHKVILLSCSQTLTQYKVIQNRLGNNLEKATTERRFKFISLLNLISSDPTTTFQEDGLSSGAACTLDSLSHTIRLALDELEVIKSDTQRSCLIAVDDVTTLLDLGYSPHQVLSFLSKLRSITSTCLLTSGSSYESLDLSPSYQSVANQLTHWSCLHMSVGELATGLSKDVHGQLRIQWRTPGAVCLPPADTYHYKLSDRDIKVFAVGASPAVL